MFLLVSAEDLEDAWLIVGLIMSLCEIRLAERGTWKEIQESNDFSFVFEMSNPNDYTNPKFTELASALERANAEFQVTQEEDYDATVVYGFTRYYLVHTEEE